MAFLRPNEDAIDGGWLNDIGSNDNLYASLNETTAVDTSYIQSPANPVNAVCKIALSDPTGTLAEPFTLRYRYNNIGGAALTVRLLQGTTPIASWVETDAGWQMKERLLTSPQFAAMGGVYTDLFIELTATSNLLPFPVTNLVVWLDGNEFSSASDGTAIDTWTDQKGANDATQATSGRRPTVTAAGLNGMPVVNFVDPQFLSLPSAAISGATQASVFFVTKTNPLFPTPTGAPVSSGTAPDSDHWPYGGGGALYSSFASDVRVLNGAVPPGGVDPVRTWHIGNLNSAPSAWSCYFNGTVLHSTATNNVTPGSSPLIGMNSAGTTWMGQIAELLLFSAVPDTTTREKIEGYLAHRWGIASVLPVGHPYKSTPP